MSTTIKPLGNQVLISPAVKRSRATGDAVIVPEGLNDPRSGKQHLVLAVGPGKRNRKGVLIPPEVQVGDYVLFNGDHDHQTLYDGRKVVNADQLLARWRYET